MTVLYRAVNCLKLTRDQSRGGLQFAKDTVYSYCTAARPTDGSPARYLRVPFLAYEPTDASRDNFLQRHDRCRNGGACP